MVVVPPPVNVDGGSTSAGLACLPGGDRLVPVTDVRGKVRRGHHLAIVTQKKAIAVGRPNPRSGIADAAVRTGTMLEQHLLAPRLGELGSDQAGDEVAAAARGVAVHQHDGLAGVVLRLRAGCEDSEQSREEETGALHKLSVPYNAIRA